MSLYIDAECGVTSDEGEEEEETEHESSQDSAASPNGRRVYTMEDDDLPAPHAPVGKRSRKRKSPAHTAEDDNGEPETQDVESTSSPPAKRRMPQVPPVDRSGRQYMNRFLSTTLDGERRFVARLMVVEVQCLEECASKLQRILSGSGGGEVSDVEVTLERDSVDDTSGKLVLAAGSSGLQVIANLKIHYEPGDEWKWHDAENPPSVALNAKEFLSNVVSFCIAARRKQSRFFNLIFAESECLFATATITTATGVSIGAERLGKSRAHCTQPYTEPLLDLPDPREHSFHHQRTVEGVEFKEYLRSGSLRFELLPTTLGFIEGFNSVKIENARLIVSAFYSKIGGSENFDETLSFVVTGGNGSRTLMCKQTHCLKPGEHRWSLVANAIQLKEEAERNKSTPSLPLALDLNTSRGGHAGSASDASSGPKVFYVTDSLSVKFSVAFSIITTCQKGIKCCISLPLNHFDGSDSNAMVFSLSGSVVRDLGDGEADGMDGSGDKDGSAKSGARDASRPLPAATEAPIYQEREEIWTATLCVPQLVLTDDVSVTPDQIFKEAQKLESLLPPEHSYVDEDGGVFQMNKDSMSSWAE